MTRRSHVEDPTPGKTIRRPWKSMTFGRWTLGSLRAEAKARDAARARVEAKETAFASHGPRRGLADSAISAGSSTKEPEAGPPEDRGQPTMARGRILGLLPHRPGMELVQKPLPRCWRRRE